jgi:hypothetical protein
VAEIVRYWDIHVHVHVHIYLCNRCISQLFMTKDLDPLSRWRCTKIQPYEKHVSVTWRSALSPLCANTSANITYSCNRIIIQNIYGLSQWNTIWSIDSLLTFEDTKGINRSHISKEDRQYNGQKKRTKGQKMICKTLHRKLQIEQSKPQVKTLVNWKCSGRDSSSTSDTRHVTPVTNVK